MEGKLIKLELSEGYRLDDLNGNYIASTLNGKNKLSLKNCLAIENGYDLDELALDYYKLVFGNTKSYKDGFQKAVELLGDKKFSEEDVKKAIEFGMKSYHSWKVRNEDEFIQSLQQTEFDVEIVMEQDYLKWKQSDIEDIKDCLVPKLDEDGCLILKRK
jgi:hypothetical protein